MTPLDPSAYRELVRRALAEDIGAGDLTTSAAVPRDRVAHAEIVVKSACVVAGLDVACEAFRQVEPALAIETLGADGRRAQPGERLARLEGSAAAMLSAERTALNFLQHLSGIATLTRRFVDATGGRTAILDTRKTVPTLRALAKYAVRCGGGTNHRIGLYDAVLIKENHARSAGGIAPAIARARGYAPGRSIEVEAQSLGDVDEAVEAGADVIMFDNLTDAEMREAMTRVGGRARVEISGGVTLDRIPALAAIGADWISVGAITHSAPAADISLEFLADA